MPTKKMWFQYWSAKWVLRKVQYFRRQWLTFSYMLPGYIKIIINTECYLQYLLELPQQPDKKKKTKKNMVMKSFLVLASNKKKKHIWILYVPNQLEKILRTVSPYLALQHKVSMSSACFSWHVQLLDPSTQMSKN